MVYSIRTTKSTRVEHRSLRFLDRFNGCQEQVIPGSSENLSVPGSRSCAVSLFGAMNCNDVCLMGDDHGMNRRILSFIALAVSMLYGVGFTVIHHNQAYATVGGVVVALCWIAVGMLGRDDKRGRDRE